MAKKQRKLCKIGIVAIVITMVGQNILPVAATEQTPECNCTTACQEGFVDSNCPLCSQGDAYLTECLGQSDNDLTRQSDTMEKTIASDAIDLPASDELLMGYLQQQMYAQAGISTLSSFEGDQLSGYDKKLYDLIKTNATQVAGGKLETTSWTLDVDDPGQYAVDVTELGMTLKSSYTKEEMNQIIDEMLEKTGMHSDRLLSAIVSDFPYEMYWFDKQKGISLGYSYSWSVDQNGQMNHFQITSFTVRLSVSSEYSGSASYTVDTSKTSQASKVVAKAQAIVAKYADKTDVEKLNGYRQEICDLVSYNDDAAANENTPYGNPWQLIWVFDGDSTTNVVCEGYAKAFQYLCDLTTFSGDVSCYTVTGMMGGGTGAGRHMWNIVTMEDGKNYLVDITNCDTGTVGAPDALFLAGLTGSVADGYTFKRDGLNTVTYTYDADLISVYGSVLNLSNTNYTPSKPSEPSVTLSGDHVITYGSGLVTATVANVPSGQTPVYSWFLDDQSIAQQTTENTYDLSHLDARTEPYQLQVIVTIDSHIYESDIFTVTVGKATPTITFENQEQTSIYTATSANVEKPAVILKNDEVYEGDIAYRYVKDGSEQRIDGLPTEVGDYTIFAYTEAFGNYTEAEGSCALTIQYLQGPVEILYDGQAKKDYYRAPVTITAPGYTISTTLEGPYTDSYVIQATGESVDTTLYFKNELGQITDAHQVNIGFDMGKPEVTVRLANKTWTELSSDPSVTKYQVDDPSLIIDVFDGGGVAMVQYSIDSSHDLYTTVEELKQADLNWIDYEGGLGAKIDLTEDLQQAVYVHVVDVAGNETYVSTGSFIVDNTPPILSNMIHDPQIYTASIAFSVSEDSQYYYVILPKTTDPLSAIDIIYTVDPNAFVAQGGQKLSAVAQGQGEAKTSDHVQLEVSGLSGDTEYTVAVVAVEEVVKIDESGVAQSGLVSDVLSGHFKTLEEKQPVIKGQAVYGAELSFDGNGLDLTNVSYQWYRNGVAIDGATGSTYMITADDIGSQLSLRVMADELTDPMVLSISSQQNGGDKVDKAPCPDENDVKSLKIENASLIFTGVTGVTYEYSLDAGKTWTTVMDSQLETNGDQVTGTIDLGAYSYAAYSLQVRAKESDYYTSGRVLSNVDDVTAKLQGTVGLEGVMQYGETLMANVQDSQVQEGFHYSFMRNDDIVQSGSSNTYTLVGDDIGQTITVSVTADMYAGSLTTQTQQISKRTIKINVGDVSKAYGEEDPVFHYTIDSTTPLVNGDRLQGQLGREPGENAGTYLIQLGTLSHLYYDIQIVTDAKLTINPTDYTIQSNEYQTVVYEVGQFVEPIFVGINDEMVTGSLSYLYNNQSYTYEQMQSVLAGLPKASQVTIQYTFIPDENGNYTGKKQGRMIFVIKDVEFFVNDKAATPENALLFKDDPTYGDSWEDLITIGDIEARAGSNSDDHPSYRLNVSGQPNAGIQNYQVLYSGTINGKEYQDVIVFEGQLTIAPLQVKVSAGSYQMSKIYDGTLATGEITGELDISGILPDDDVHVEVLPSSYTDPNVGGQDTFWIRLSLKGEDSENYVLSTTSLQAPCSITPQTIEPKITVVGSYAYTGSAIVPVISVETENVVLSALDYEVAYQNNINAGTATVIIEPREGSNYTWLTPITTTFEIAKVAYQGQTSVSTVMTYGSDAVLDLSAYLPEGYAISGIEVDDPSGILQTVPQMDGKELVYSLNDESHIGQSANLIIHVSKTTNYEPFDIQVKITVSDKAIQPLQFNESTISRTYGDEDFVNDLQGVAEGTRVTYRSRNPEVATVDDDGQVTIHSSGTTMITATTEENSQYASSSASYMVNIAKAPLYWDVSELQAVDQEDQITQNMATLSGQLKVSGILEKDQADVTFICLANQLVGRYVVVQPGTVTVTLDWADPANPVQLTGEKAHNYLLPHQLPTIVGSIETRQESSAENQTEEQTVQTSDDTNDMLWLALMVIAGISFSMLYWQRHRQEW